MNDPGAVAFLALYLFISGAIIFFIYAELDTDSLDLTKLNARFLMIPVINFPFLILLLLYILIKSIPVILKDMWKRTGKLP